MNYIGIRGHRGAGKMTVSYLLGCTIEYIINPMRFSNNFDNQFKLWCDLVKDDEYITSHSELDKIYFSSFKETPELMTELLLGTFDISFDNFNKDHIIINLKDFTYKTYQQTPENIKLLTAEELYELFKDKKEPTAITKDIYVTLREFVMYFGREVMQRFFGLNVWVKTLRNSDERYKPTYNDFNYYKIFMDVKYPSEVTYIKDKGGVIIKVTRPGHKKRGVDKLLHDDRVDYNIEIGESLYDLKDTIYELANTIINSNKNINREYVEETN